MVHCASLLAAMAVAAASDIPKGFLGKSVTVGGKAMKYVVYMPDVYDPAKPCPAIVFLNGSGECGTDGWKQIAVGLGPAVMTAVDKWPFIVLFPQKQVTDAGWEDEDAMVMAELDAARRDYNIDSSRIYLTGLSQGGHGTWAIGALHPDTFAAIAPICGWGDKDMAAKLVKMPIWVFHGEADNAVNVSSARDMEAFLKEAGGSCKLTIYPGVGHNSWDKAYREENLGAWFLEQSRQDGKSR